MDYLDELFDYFMDTLQKQWEAFCRRQKKKMEKQKNTKNSYQETSAAHSKTAAAVHPHKRKWGSNGEVTEFELNDWVRTGKDVLYFELNSWISGEGYPKEEPFLSWFQDDIDRCKLEDSWWDRENKICVRYYRTDQSYNWTLTSKNFLVTATREWIDENCPAILRYPEFLRFPDKHGTVKGRYGQPFLEYREENFGLSYEVSTVTA